MARIFDTQSHSFENASHAGNGNSELELPVDQKGLVHEVLQEFRSEWLRACGIREASKWIDARKNKNLKPLITRWTKTQASIGQTITSLQRTIPGKRPVTEQQRWVLDNARFLRQSSKGIQKALKSMGKLRSMRPRAEQADMVPRAYQVATGFLLNVRFVFDEEQLSSYVTGIQQVAPLEMRELWALKPLLQLVLLEQLEVATETVLDAPETGYGSTKDTASLPSTIITSIRDLSEMEWKEFFEAHSVVDHILRADPAGAYPWMDFESRQLYRDALSNLARYTKLSEAEVARHAVRCAQGAMNRKRKMSQRATDRRRNVGYYLTDHGVMKLRKMIEYRPSLKEKIKNLLMEWPEVYYVAGVELTTLVTVFLLLWHLGTVIPLIPGLLLLIPASQAAVDLINHLTVWILSPRRLPRLDFSEGIPEEFATLVVVPTLLLNEKEVRHIVELLEVRYLGNRDPNLQFALLTDSPDTTEHAEEQDELVELCSSLVNNLNAKYARDRQGGFYHFHRHRVFNPRENRWMGWERKRGKLLDLNKFLLGEEDNFPVKAGDLSILPQVRYVITLDSDTRLPRDTAYKLVGTIAHPLNRAVIGRNTKTVIEGYGILQPRVGVSIESAHKSRLASIYSGETGFDIYTCAVSDVYQDLFGEGSFTGKGIYEVETFQHVLGNRFPSNALLSHDLIEGVYARAGLVSDVEVIDDYPSHFSAYCRRMHRWVRGDWQILRWLLPNVPDFFGRRVPNPITLISRWKIFDNLRRSLIELNLFLLLLAGWFVLPGGAFFWTVVILALLLAPTYVQLFFSLLQLKGVENYKGFLKDRANAFVTGHLQFFLMLVFLPHKAFVMVDAIVRTLTRLTFTHKNLLEWETAAEAEAGTRKRTAVEVYLGLTPWFATTVALGMAFVRPSALAIAAPILTLWLLAGVITQWINSPPRRRRKSLSPRETDFLRLASLATWRYFHEFSNPGVNWLIPDRVQETPPVVMKVISPTNLGILLNARLAAHHLGYLTLTELIEQTEATVSSAKKLPRFKGHFLNWYDIQTLKPLPPRFVSTVDSGNLAACLWTLKEACYGLLREPILCGKSTQGIADHLSLVQQLLKQRTVPPEVILHIQTAAVKADHIGKDPVEWIAALNDLQSNVRESVAALDIAKEQPGSARPSPPDELSWWLSQTLERIENLQRHVLMFAPWLLPEYGQVGWSHPDQQLTLESLPSIVSELAKQLEGLPLQTEANNATAVLESLRSRLEISLHRATEFSQRLRKLAAEADSLLNDMDFRFLYDSKRKLLRIGHDTDAQESAKSLYDLLGSEARTATFIAIAKGDIRQEAWFHLGRSHVRELGETVLVSWSGTLFEYLMPLLWMHSYPETLLDRAVLSAVICQQRYARKKNIPWGISETTYSERDYKGIYQYAAFGLPGLAADPDASKRTVVAPYASFLALPVDPLSATHNLRVMWEKGWFGRYGFYESADYSAERTTDESADYELIRCWMAHHQGMSLLAVSNLLTQPSLQSWFHQEPRVMATELLLHEKVPSAAPEKPEPAATSQAPLRKPSVETPDWSTPGKVGGSAQEVKSNSPGAEVPPEAGVQQTEISQDAYPPQG